MKSLLISSVASIPLTWGGPFRTRGHFRVALLILLLVVASVVQLTSRWPQDYVRGRLSSGALRVVAEEWKDNIWPYRHQTPWDISTDFRYPRKLEYDVTEGTWLRLDVHPKSGEIVFDMLGDVYCLPADVYSSHNLDGQLASRARPVLLGIPHDSDPHFSPEGDRLIFRSDAELGIENIWITEWKGCDNMDVRPVNATGELLHALAVQDIEEQDLARGRRETPGRKHRRLVREGRFGAQRVTNETYRWVTDARFHPSGQRVVATKWSTWTSTIGSPEGWEYSISDGPNHIEAGSGRRLVSKSLPPGWSEDRYPQQMVGPEQFIWLSEDTLVWSKNVKDTDGGFAYNKDVHQGIYAIFKTNMTTEETVTLVDSSPGGASRPELSRDKRTLAFVRRVRDKEALVLKDLVTGTIRHIWHGLTYDITPIVAYPGTYPSFAFTPDDSAIVIWAAGQIYHVPLTINDIGERILAGSPSPIRFKAHIEKRLAETIHTTRDYRSLATLDTQRIYSLTDLRVSADGNKALFHAAGVNYVHSLGDARTSEPRPIPMLEPNSSYFSPNFVPGNHDLIVQARWSNTNFTTFELANLTSGVAYELDGLPLGRYYSLTFSDSSSHERRVAFIKSGADILTGGMVATANTGLYIGDVTLPRHGLLDQTKLHITNTRLVSTKVNGADPYSTTLRFLEKGQKILVEMAQEVFVVDVAAEPDKYGQYPHRIIAKGRMSNEMAIPSPGGSIATDSVDIAYMEYWHLYFAPAVRSGEQVWSKPGRNPKGLVRLTVDGGHHITWSDDGKKLFWLLGPVIHSIELSKLHQCASEIEEDQLTFGFSCVAKMVVRQEIFVEYATDVARLKQEVAERHEGPGADHFVIYNATLLTMEDGNLANDLVLNAVLVTRGGEIHSVTTVEDAIVPTGATVYDAQGGFVVPGFIDMHAHWNGYRSYYPARSWQLETFLAYGVTTLHNPSTHNVRGPWERDRIERGHILGPRFFQTGTAVFAGGWVGLHEEIVNMDEAYAALRRIQADGGPMAFSYKNYELPSRASRQRLLLAARNLSMICVPEGGMNWDWDQTYIQDGMTTVEHSLPISVLYDDVKTLFALSGTASDPTHVVNYGGVYGSQLVRATHDVPNDPKLRRFMPHDILDGLAESTSRPMDSYAVFNTSASAADMVHKGLRVLIGSHGEQPMGLNYHEEMWFTRQGGLTNYETLRAATSHAALTLGIFSSLGSLTPGKLADFLVYPPHVDLLDERDIRQTREIKYVVKGGRVFEAETLVEVWPVRGRKEPLPPFNAD